VNVVGRRRLVLDDPPGAVVTIAPFTYRDFQAVSRMLVDFETNAEALADLFVQHIEDHPWDCAASDLDAPTLRPIMAAWTASLQAPLPLRGHRH
jgi:hypothetical protein